MPFSQKNVHTFFVCFSFFPLKKTKKYIYQGWKQGLYIYFFVFLNGKKEKQTKKVCTFFCEKCIIIIVPFFLELYFFPGIIFFFRGYIFLVPRFVFFFLSSLCIESFGANNHWIYQLFSGHWLPNLKNPKLAAQHQQLWTNIVSKQKKLYFWGPSNLRKHSFKNYSSGKKGTTFLGGHPNLKKHSFKKL